ncbi:hypothetical protein [Comamonas terrigena]|uniref:hypothetical protein n=1 Tax=Comamonas terrigena TaxID=32013 RepID=UPI0028A28E38|nr:hypothetical protein [Comamonas terrigena]
MRTSFSSSAAANNKLTLYVPFEYKDAFRELFKTARWDSFLEGWEVADTTANKNKFERFKELASSAAGAERLAKTDETSVEEMERVEATLSKRIEAAKARSAAAKAAAARLAPLVAEKHEALEQMARAADAAEAEAAAAAEPIVEALASVDDNLQVLARFTRVPDYLRSSKKPAAVDAQRFLAKKYSALLALGIEIPKLKELAEVNPNRPDRLKPLLEGCSAETLARSAKAA